MQRAARLHEPSARASVLTTHGLISTGACRAQGALPQQKEGVCSTSGRPQQEEGVRAAWLREPSARASALTTDGLISTGACRARGALPQLKKRRATCWRNTESLRDVPLRGTSLQLLMSGPLCGGEGW